MSKARIRNCASESRASQQPRMVRNCEAEPAGCGVGGGSEGEGVGVGGGVGVGLSGLRSESRASCQRMKNIPDLGSDGGFGVWGVWGAFRA